LTRIYGYEFLLIVTAAAYLAIAMGVIWSARKVMGPAPFKKTAARELRKNPAEILRIVREYPIVRYLIISGLLPNILLPIFTYQFSVISQNSFASEDGLLTFLSIFRGSTTLVSFLLLFVMGRIYTRMGVPNASLLQPLNFALIFFALIPFFNIFVAAYGQFSIIFVQRAIAGPVNKVLFNVVPDGVGAWSRVFVRGTVIKAAVIAGALIILILKPLVSAHGLSIVAAAIAGYLIYETLLFKNKYTQGLKQTLMDDAIDLDQMVSEFTLNPDMTSMVLMSDSLSPIREDVELGRFPIPDLTVETALENLGHADKHIRARAAAYFMENPDPRAIHRLMNHLDDQEWVREAAIEALAGYGETAQPFLESELIDSPARIQLGILKAMKCSGLRDYDLLPFVAQQSTEAYNHLAAIAALSNGVKEHSVDMLIQHLQEKNEEILGMIFYALWVNDPNMRFMYRSLRTLKASTSVEMFEASIDREMAKYLVPLIDDIPLTEKIEHGRKALPIIRTDAVSRILPRLARSHDPITRMLTAYTIGEYLPEMRFYSALERLREDPDAGVVQAAGYAMKRCMKGEAKMPEAIYDISVVKKEALFKGVGIRGYKAIASIAIQKFHKAGDILMAAGEEVLFLYLLMDGQVGVFDNYGTAGQRQKITLNHGDILGEIGLLSSLPATQTYVVVSDFLEALVFTRQAFYEILGLYPQISINLSRQFAVRLSRPGC